MHAVTADGRRAERPAQRRQGTGFCARGRTVLALGLVATTLAASGCGGGGGGGGGGSKQSGGGGSSSGAGSCLGDDPKLTGAIRSYIATVKDATTSNETDAARTTIDVCKHDADDATATVVVYGLKDRLIKDVHHDLTLVRTGGLWTIGNDQAIRRCQPGKGHQGFSGDSCG